MSTPDVQDPVFSERDDDDGMPPLVDNPYPSMTFTFATDMTPITYSSDPTRFEVVPESATQQTMLYDPISTESIPEIPQTPHSKKKDASYIPRPPNAFILFRSSFIRAQHIPGKIEGNHSSLSKIIGKYWKSLPREEREVWEAKAIVAQAEHRKKYPDWRFRPAANALAKVKDGPRRRSNRKGRGQAEKEVRSREQRCAKIADLLVAGKMGSALEAAIEQYDCENGSKGVKQEGGMIIMQVQDLMDVKSQITLDESDSSKDTNDSSAEVRRKDGRSLSPASSPNALLKTPLTAMFKRSSSAPAPYTRSSIPNPSAGNLARRDSISSASSAYSPNFLSSVSGSPLVNLEDQTRVGGDVVLPNRTLSLNVNGCHGMHGTTSDSFSDYTDVPQNLHWDDTYNSTPYSPSLPAFDQDDGSSSPLHSPIPFCFDIQRDEQFSNPLYSNPPTPSDITPTEASYILSSNNYSTVGDWTGNSYAKVDTDQQRSLLSPPFSPTAQTPLYYDAASVMKDAFAAAAIAPFDWNTSFLSTKQAACRISCVGESIPFFGSGQTWSNMPHFQGDHIQLF